MFWNAIFSRAPQPLAVIAAPILSTAPATVFADTAMAYVAIFKASLVALAASRYSSSVILPVASEQIFLLPVLFLELLVAESTSHAKLNKRL